MKSQSIFGSLAIAALSVVVSLYVRSALPSLVAYLALIVFLLYVSRDVKGFSTRFWSVLPGAAILCTGHGIALAVGRSAAPAPMWTLLILALFLGVVMAALSALVAGLKPRSSAARA
jgi:hypothetical protein